MRVSVRRQLPEPVRVSPNRQGTDVANPERTRDIHIRLETFDVIGDDGLPGGKEESICVDIFDSTIPREATARLNPHVDSDCFDNTDEGAEDATEFLKLNEIFNVKVLRGGLPPEYQP